jgi:tetratricopeptide (TPR) repeat protein
MGSKKVAKIMNQFSIIKKLFFVGIFILITNNQMAMAGDVAELNLANLTNQGIAAYQRGSYDDAVKFLSARARQTPEDANVYYYLGNCYLHLNRNDQAAHMFSACVRVSPTSQAGKYALSALESLSSMPKANDKTETTHATLSDPSVNSKAIEAARDALTSHAPIDKSFNEAVARIKSQRRTLQVRVDKLYEQMQDDLSTIHPRLTSNYISELERIRRTAEIRVQEMQTTELRYENRLLAPEKIDVRSIPQLPQEKTDNTKTALGSLLEYFKPDKPYDPFGAEITPEITSKFMSLKDVFGELSTYLPASRIVAKQAFSQLKHAVENKQDWLDRQIVQIKESLVKDICNIQSNYGALAMRRQQTPAYHASSAQIPRANQENLSQMELEISQATERAKNKIKHLEDSYYRDIDSLIAGAKEKVSSMVAQTGNINKQMQKPSGTIQIVPLGTTLYNRNYVNFGERNTPNTLRSPSVIDNGNLPGLKAKELKLQTKTQKPK